mmetsp:Transcript_11062/g.16740  ORF Transcript_11062/g.16740 Transcript_11062/m.16740 type:complete len:211 (+) Transcript_11062:89-721(+)
MTGLANDLMLDENKKLSEFAEEIKLFGKWNFKLEFNKDDTSLKDQMNWAPRWYPHTSGRWQKKRFKKIQCPIVERLTNCLMMHGRNSGKKIKAVNIVKQALEIIAVMKGEDTNPLQVLLQALENGGPREDSTRVGSAGVVRRQAVDVAPLTRVNQAMALIVAGSRRAAFRNIKSMSECLADEIILCAANNPNSYAIKKKTELERVAKSNR